MNTKRVLLSFCVIGLIAASSSAEITTYVLTITSGTAVATGGFSGTDTINLTMQGSFKLLIDPATNFVDLEDIDISFVERPAYPIGFDWSSLVGTIHGTSISVSSDWPLSSPGNQLNNLSGTFDGNTAVLSGFVHDIAYDGYTYECSFTAVVFTEVNLTVANGSGSGIYTPGQGVVITADTPATGMVFDEWTGDTAGIPGAALYVPSTTITLNQPVVSVTATYTHDGDLNRNGVVDIADLNMVLMNWGKSGGDILPPQADANGDDTVDIVDLNMVLIDWGK